MIPTRADDLTTEWLAEVLGRRVQVLGHEPLGVGVGLVGQLHRLSVEWSDGDGPPTLVAKLAAEGEESRFVATVLNMYGREHGFYTELAARTRLAHPRCLYAEHDPATQDSVLVLEDVAGRGRQLDQIGGARLDEVGAAIDALADFHAGWWDADELARHDWLKPLGADPYPDAVGMAYTMGWPTVQELLADLCTERVQVFGDAYAAIVPALFARLSEPPVVLSHADYRLDNLFFPESGAPIAVDWQLVDRSTGPRDLAYLVTQSLEIDDPADYRRALDRYVDGLRAQGIDVDPAWAFEQYRLGAVLGFVYPVIAGGSLTVADPRHVRLVHAMLRRCIATLDALDAWEPAL